MNDAPTYQRRTPISVHPADQIRKKAYDFRGETHPVREIIKKCLGTHALTAVVEEDIQTLGTMKDVEGLVAFLCTLVKDGRVIAQGRGSSVISPTNRFIQRAVACAFNASFADAAIRSSKVLDTFRGKTGISEEEYPVDEPATDRQREFLRQLVHTNIADEEELERWESQIGEFTKAEASKAIESFKR